MCGLDKEKQGIVLWLALPSNDPRDIKELIHVKVGADEQRKETGLQKFMEATDEAFKPTDECRKSMTTF